MRAASFSTEQAEGILNELSSNETSINVDTDDYSVFAIFHKTNLDRLNRFFEGRVITQMQYDVSSKRLIFFMTTEVDISKIDHDNTVSTVIPLNKDILKALENVGCDMARFEVYLGDENTNKFRVLQLYKDSIAQTVLQRELRKIKEYC